MVTRKLDRPRETKAATAFSPKQARSSKAAETIATVTPTPQLAPALVRQAMDVLTKLIAREGTAISAPLITELLLSAGLSIGQATLALSAAHRLLPKYRTDQLLVTIDPQAVHPGGRGRLSASRLEKSLEDPFAALERDGLIEDVTAIGLPTRERSTAAAALTASVAPTVDEELSGLSVIRLAPGAAVDEVLRRLDDIPAVREIERVPFRTVTPLTSQSNQVPTGAVLVPWNLERIQWRDRQPPDAAVVKVAVLDTGVDESHPDLDIAAYNYEGASAEDIVGHGTHVSGILAGQLAKNLSFYSGVSNAGIYVWKIFGDQPDPAGRYLVDEYQYQRALLACLQEGCKVLNLSIGGTGTTKAERNLFARLVKGGVVIVAAMGNDYLRGNPTEYPAAHADVVAVGAIGSDLLRAPFSNTGNHISLVAPGVGIWSTLPLKASVARSQTSYAAWDGTSMAAPHVSAAAARLLAANPGWAPAQLKTALQASALKLAPMQSQSWTRLYGSGLLQV